MKETSFLRSREKTTTRSRPVARERVSTRRPLRLTERPTTSARRSTVRRPITIETNTRHDSRLDALFAKNKELEQKLSMKKDTEFESKRRLSRKIVNNRKEVEELKSSLMQKEYGERRNKEFAKYEDLGVDKSNYRDIRTIARTLTSKGVPEKDAIIAARNTQAQLMKEAKEHYNIGETPKVDTKVQRIGIQARGNNIENTPHDDQLSKAEEALGLNDDE